MITEKEFQEALKIVNLYVEQLKATIKENLIAVNNIKNTPILDWIREQKKRNDLNSNHTRLFSFLEYAKKEYEYEYIEDFKDLDISKFSNVGKKTRDAFNHLFFVDSNEADA